VPLYEFSCAGCGPFDLRRDLRDAPGAAAPCPTCDQVAQRRYRIGAGRPPGGTLRDAGPADRARVERARSGEPMITGPPSGRRLPGGAPHRH
jgi:putative FmdB family regulatory protein